MICLLIGSHNLTLSSIINCLNCLCFSFHSMRSASMQQHKTHEISLVASSFSKAMNLLRGSPREKWYFRANLGQSQRSRIQKKTWGGWIRLFIHQGGCTMLCPLLPVETIAICLRPRNTSVWKQQEESNYKNSRKNNANIYAYLRICLRRWDRKPALLMKPPMHSTLPACQTFNLEIL